MTDASGSAGVFEEANLDVVFAIEVEDLLDSPVSVARRSNDKSRAGILSFLANMGDDLLHNDHLLVGGTCLGLLLESGRVLELHGDLATVVWGSRGFVGHGGEVEDLR